MAIDYKYILNLSGAATKIAGLAGASDYIYNVAGYRPTDITGVSSGALLGIPIAMRKWDGLRNLTQTFTLDDIFDKKPINKDNKITFRAKSRAILGKTSFGTQNNLYKTLASVISENEFKRYQEGDYPNVWIGSVNFIDGSRIIINLKEKKYSYYDFLTYTIASASIPLAVESVYHNNMILYDGGVRNHILSAWALEELKNIKETISVFARPQNYSNILDREWEDKNMIKVFERFTDISVIEISKRDEKEEQLLLSNNKKIKNKQIFIPSIIKELYDTNPEKLRKLYNAGFKTAATDLDNW